MKPTILTNNGQYFDFENPEDYTFDIGVIAHALSNLCRFTGHTKYFYSVAQHSVYVSNLMPSGKNLKLAGLLHDAAEAFVGDVSAPLKHLLPDYKAIEKRVEAAIFNHFGLPPLLLDEVKQFDLCLLATEQRDLMSDAHSSKTVRWSWQDDLRVRPLPFKIAPYSPEAACQFFLNRYEIIINSHD